MSVSPLAFLRGSAPLFYELLSATGDADPGSSPRGWIVGDAHLENFGAFRVAPSPGERASGKMTVFGLNDFDEAREGPWRWDVLRLATSLILAGRELGVDGRAALDLSEKLIQSHVNSAFEGAPLLPAPAPVESLLAQDRLRPVFLFDAVRTRRVSPDEMRVADPDLRTLRNLNTREDYEAALRELSWGPPLRGGRL